MRHPSPILGGVLALVALVLLVGTNRGAPADEEPILATAPGLDPAAAPALDRVEDSGLRGPMRLFDRLSGEELVADMEIVQESSAPIHVERGADVDLTDLDPEAELQAAITPDAEPTVAPVADSTTWTGSEWHSILPYNAGLRVRIVGAPPRSNGVHGDFYVLESPNAVSQAASEAGASGRFAPDLEQMTFEGKARRLSRRGLLKRVFHARADELLSAQMYEPLEGEYLVLWADRSGNQAMGLVELTPGQETDLVIARSPRPALTGRLLDWNMEPVPHGSLKAIIQLDLGTYDFLPQDPHAFGALNGPTIGKVHTVDQFYKTDAEGRFSITVPRGKAYALQSFERSSYGFWSTIESGRMVGDSCSVDLVLAEPSAARRLTVAVQDARGEPLAGATIFAALVEDIPFMRQWPDAALSAEGTASFAGLGAGARAAIAIMSDKIVGGIHVERLLIPTEPRLTITIPAGKSPAD